MHWIVCNLNKSLKRNLSERKYISSLTSKSKLLNLYLQGYKIKAIGYAV